MLAIDPITIIEFCIKAPIISVTITENNDIEIMNLRI